MACQSTFALSAEVKLGNAHVVDHRLADGAEVAKSVLFFVDKNSGEGGKIDAASDGSAKADADGWRRSFHNTEPEKEDANISKLVAALWSQAPTNFDCFSERRDLAARRAAFMEKRRRQKVADKTVRETMKKNAASSSDSSSSVESASSSSSSCSSN